MEKIQVIERAFQILELIAAEPNSAHTVSELAERTGLKVPTVSKIVRTMNLLGYLEFAGRKEGYLLGKKTANLGRFYRDRNPLRRVAMPFLRDFRNRFGEYICVSVLQDSKRYIAACEPATHMVQISCRLYPEVENPCQSVSGRVLMAGLSDEQRERCFERNGPPGKLWEAVKTREEFFRELNRIAGLDYLLEIKSEAAAISLPIRRDGEVIAALGVYVPEYRFGEERRQDILNAMAAIATGIARSGLL